MKKRIFAMLLSVLMLASTSACNYTSNSDAKYATTNESDGTNDLSTNNTQNNNNESQEMDKVQPSVYTTQNLVDALQLSNVFSLVLKNETKVWDPTDNSLTYLKDFIIGSMAYAYVSTLDLDENGINDVLVLENGDKVIVLKEHEETVYAWQYRHTALYNLLVDGTYSWSEQAGNIYGTDKLRFHGAQKEAVELDRVEYNEKFYINEIEVSKDTFQIYVQNQKSTEKVARYWWKTGFETSDYQENGK